MSAGNATSPASWEPPAPVRSGPGPGLFELMSDSENDYLGLIPASAYREPYFHKRIGLYTVFSPMSREGIQHVLVKNFENYPKDIGYRRHIQGLVGEGLLLSEGDTWRQQRKASAPVFTPGSVARVAEISASVIDRFVREQVIPVGRPVDLPPLIERITLEIAVQVLLSIPTGSKGGSLQELMADWVRRTGLDMFDTILPAWMPAPKSLRRRRLGRRFDDLMTGFLAERNSTPTPETQGDLYYLLSEVFDPHENTPQPGGILDQIKTFLVAGTITTADTLFWALATLATNQDAQDWVAGSLSGRALEPEQASATLPSLAEVKAVVREILRLYPAIPIMGRVTKRDDVVAGEKVRAGTLVYVCPWIMHRHRTYWDNPDAFEPSRFMPGAPEPDRFIYMPFGAGPRVCIGQHFGLTEAIIVISKLLSSFTIAPLDNRPIKPRGSITIPPVDPPQFVLHPRARAV